MRLELPYRREMGLVGSLWNQSPGSIRDDRVGAAGFEPATSRV